MSILPSNSHSNTWFNEPIAVYRDGYDYYGIYGDTGIVGVAKYDREREILEVGHPRGTTAAAIAVDDHNNPAVLALSNGKILGSATNTTSTVTFNRFTIGGLRRVTQGSPAAGCVIGAVAVGSGSFPSPLHIHMDMINGQFGGSWEPPALQAATVRRVCPGILVS